MSHANTIRPVRIEKYLRSLEDGKEEKYRICKTGLGSKTSISGVSAVINTSFEAILKVETKDGKYIEKK
jgi:hypothetical protein